MPSSAPSRYALPESLPAPPPSLPLILCPRSQANDGFLYPLENGFLFVYKPTIYIRREHIKHISFERVKDTASTNRSFDIEVGLDAIFANCRVSARNPSPVCFLQIEEKDGTTHEFHGIQKEEYVSVSSSAPAAAHVVVGCFLHPPPT